MWKEYIRPDSSSERAQNEFKSEVEWVNFYKLHPEEAPRPDESNQMALNKLEKCLNHSASVIDASEANNAILMEIMASKGLKSSEMDSSEQQVESKKTNRKTTRHTNRGDKKYQSESSKSKDNYRNFTANLDIKKSNKKLPKSAP